MVRPGSLFATSSNVWEDTAYGANTGTVSMEDLCVVIRSPVTGVNGRSYVLCMTPAGLGYVATDMMFRVFVR